MALKGKVKAPNCGPEMECSLLSGREGRLIAHSQGLVYRDASHEVLLPWPRIQKGGIEIDEAVCLRVRLKGAEPGRDYVLRRFPDHLDYRDCEAPYILQGAVFSLIEPLEGTATELQNCLSALQAHYIGLLIEGGLGCSSSPSQLSWVDDAQQRVRFCEAGSLHFPSFCPVSGEEADSVLNVAVDGGGVKPWFCHHSAARRLRGLQCVRVSSVVLTTLAYCVAFYTAIDPESSLIEALNYAGSLLPLFIGIPIVWHLTQAPLQLCRKGEGQLELRLADRSAFRAFLELNSSLSEHLPWRQEESL